MFWHANDPMKWLATLLFSLVGLLPLQSRPWSEDVIYFALTDRFYDGDPNNNSPVGCDPALYDPAQKNINCYQGGDLRGLEKALAAGYFTDLGITALWITPPVKNSWRSGFDLGGWKTGYHGYWAQDFLDIDPHLVSRKSINGVEYPDSREGRMQHYRDFVKLAHSRGIKVIQDVVLNHVGPLFYYDTNGDGSFQVDAESEWVRPYKKEGFYDTARWADIPKWNLTKAGPSGPMSLLGRKINTTGLLGDLSNYSRKGFNWDSLGSNDGQEMLCDFFSLRDIWTGPGASMARLAEEFAEIYAFYMYTVGVDGLRIDTVKHVHQSFWDSFTEKLRKKLGPRAAEVIIFGEVFDGNPARLGQYTYRHDWPENQGPELDSVLNFRFCFTAREYLRKTNDAFGTAHQLETAIRELHGKDPQGRPWYNQSKGLDGLNASQKSITFIENHDGINRFRVKDVSEEKHRLAQALVLLSEGIPCLYYGAEIAIQDPIGEVGQDTETGRTMLFPHSNSDAVADAKKHLVFRELHDLITLRNKTEALRSGISIPLWADSESRDDDDGVFAMARTMVRGDKFDATTTAVVVFNASNATHQTGEVELMNEGQVLAPAGSVFVGQVVVGSGSVEKVTLAEGAKAVFLAPANSAVVYTLKKNE